MDPFETSNRRREAQRRLWARRRRTGELRTRVVALTLVGFVLLWGVVFTQMATGNDPVLGAGRHSAVARTDQEAQSAGSAAQESVETTDPEEVGGEEEQLPSEVETVEPEPEFEPEPEPESELFFEPEVVETTQS
jgi:hypothetical protein